MTDGPAHVPPPEGEGHGRIARLIGAASEHPILTLVFLGAMVLWGLYALRRTPIDALPDLSETQVILFTEWPGRSPDLVESQITYPLSTALVSAPGVQAVRGQSMFGMSFVYAIFEEGTDIYWARSRILEALSALRSRLPEGVDPMLGPDATGVGWVFQYALVDRRGTHDLAALRSLQDWNVRFALQSVPGVAEVASIGGFVKEYQIDVDPNRLLAYEVSLGDVLTAVRASNSEVGGQALEIAGHEHIVRGRGYLRSVADLESIPIRLGDAGTAVLVRDVGQVTIGPAPRRGLADLDGEGEAVGGIVVMRYGENAREVIDRVKERLEDVRASLPPGVEIVVTYDRSGLIDEAMGTLRRTLIEEMIVVSLIIFLFLLHARSALVPILTLPVAVLLAFIPMFHQGLSANIMSLGGIAVAIGAMVDASVVLIENVHKRLEEWETEGRSHERRVVVVRAMQEVGPSIFFSLLVMTVSFLPIFTLEATEGRLFRPLAFTKTYSMGFSAILAVTLTPALVALFLRGSLRREGKSPLNRWLIALYAPIVRFVVDRRHAVIAVTVLAMVATIPAYLRLGSEFMPPLNEGAILYMPTAPPGMSMTEASRVLTDMNARLARFPEVERVFGKMGRAETATDPAPLAMAETIVVLKPRAAWRPDMTWDRLIAEMNEALHYPGMPNLFWMPIQTRTEMLSTGVRSPLGIQIFGDDLTSIEAAARAIEQALGRVTGTRSAFAERSTGGFYVDVTFDRARASRFGLRADDVNEVVLAAFGGAPAGEMVEGRERYPIRVRYAREFREEPDQLERAFVATADGSQIPLGQVAKVSFETGPPMLRSEDGKLVGYVFVDTDRPIGDYVRDARQTIATMVDLPPGVRIAFTGQYQALERARERMMLIVPLTLALIVGLLYWNTRSWVETAIVLLAVPFSLIGAIWLLYFLDFQMSVAVWVGLIALAGLDAEMGVVMLLYLTISHRRWAREGRLRDRVALREAIVEGAAHRIRPKLMTVLTTGIALVPILLSQGAGSDVMQRIAAPMIGGLVTSFLLELTVYPALFAMWKGRSLPAVTESVR